MRWLTASRVTIGNYTWKIGGGKISSASKARESLALAAWVVNKWMSGWRGAQVGLSHGCVVRCSCSKKRLAKVRNSAMIWWEPDLLRSTILLVGLSKSTVSR